VRRDPARFSRPSPARASSATTVTRCRVQRLPNSRARRSRSVGVTRNGASAAPIRRRPPDGVKKMFRRSWCAFARTRVHTRRIYQPSAHPTLLVPRRMRIRARSVPHWPAGGGESRLVDNRGKVDISPRSQCWPCLAVEGRCRVESVGGPPKGGGMRSRLWRRRVAPGGHLHTLGPVKQAIPESAATLHLSGRPWRAAILEPAFDADRHAPTPPFHFPAVKGHECHIAILLTHPSVQLLLVSVHDDDDPRWGLGHWATRSP
jgi:hypothetical protein